MLKTLLHKTNKLAKASIKNRVTLVPLVVVVFVGAGICVLAISHASTPTSSIEAENGTVSSAANVISDNSASNSNAVKFGEASAARTLNCVPDAADTMDNTISHLCGFPDSTNTGIEDGVTLTPSGSARADTDGETIQNLDITDGTLTIDATNVTVKNVRITRNDPDYAALIIKPGASATIEHVDVSGIGKQSNGEGLEYAILSQSSLPVTIKYANLYNSSDSIQGEYLTVTDSYIHDFDRATASHVDGIQCDSNDGCHGTFNHNTVLVSVQASAAIAIFADFGTPVDSSITDNLLAGASYTVRGGGTGTSNIHIDDNHFSNKYYTCGGWYGIMGNTDSGGTGNTITGNIWDDTGAPANSNPVITTGGTGINPNTCANGDT